MMTITRGMARIRRRMLAMGGKRIPGIRILAITCTRRRILAGRLPSALR